MSRDVRQHLQQRDSVSACLRRACQRLGKQLANEKKTCLADTSTQILRSYLLVSALLLPYDPAISPGLSDRLAAGGARGGLPYTPHPGLDVTDPLGFKSLSQRLPPRPCLSKLLSTPCQRGKRTPPQAAISTVLISFTSWLCCDPVGRARRTTVLRSVMLGQEYSPEVCHARAGEQQS